jgi:predicted outer membrane repeat protein
MNKRLWGYLGATAFAGLSVSLHVDIARAATIDLAAGCTFTTAVASVNAGHNISPCIGYDNPYGTYDSINAYNGTDTVTQQLTLSKSLQIFGSDTIAYSGTSGALFSITPSANERSCTADRASCCNPGNDTTTCIVLNIDGVTLSATAANNNATGIALNGNQSDGTFVKPGPSVKLYFYNGTIQNFHNSGIISKFADVQLYQSNFLSNSTTGNGAGINFQGLSVAQRGRLDVDGCFFDGNTARGNGGAIYRTGTLRTEGTAFFANTATNGGGIYSGPALNDSQHDAYLEVFGGYFERNSATSNGGGVYVTSTTDLEPNWTGETPNCDPAPYTGACYTTGYQDSPNDTNLTPHSFPGD